MTLDVCLCVLSLFHIMFAQLFVNRAEKAIKASGRTSSTRLKRSSRSRVFGEEDSPVETLCEVMECQGIQGTSRSSHGRYDCGNTLISLVMAIAIQVAEGEAGAAGGKLQRL